MNFKNFFKNAGNDLESAENDKSTVNQADLFTCPKCQSVFYKKDLKANNYCCPCCNHYLRLSAKLRIRLVADRGTFEEHDKDFVSSNVLDFPDYDEKLEVARKKSGINEGVITGHCKIGGYDTCIFAMDPEFMMGSMGTVLGDKLARLFEYATEHSLPVVGFTLSGGARMQEGMLSLIQMAKVSGAVKYHSDAGNLYITVLTNPTTGGITASFAMLGDIIIAEPRALVGFAGPRVVEQTTKKKLPDGFQSSEYLMDCGFVDAIVSRKEMKDYIAKLLKFHNCGKEVSK